MTAGNTPTDAELAARAAAAAVLGKLLRADAEAARLRALWAKLDAESGYAG